MVVMLLLLQICNIQGHIACIIDKLRWLFGITFIYFIFFCERKTIDQWPKVVVRIGKVKVEWHWGKKEWKKKGTASDYWEDKDPAVLGLTAPSTSGAPIPPSIHPQARHPIPSRRGNFLHPTTHPSSIYPSIHLSFPQQMEIITDNNTTTNGWLSLLSPTSHPNLNSSKWWVFWLDLSSLSQWRKEIRLNHAKNVTGRFWCGLAILSASAFHTVQANSWDACVNASIRCQRQRWFCITLDYSDTLRQLANSQ